MTDWKRIAITSSDLSVVPNQIVHADIVDQVGILGDEEFYLVSVKAGELVHHGRSPATGDESCIVSWTGDEIAAVFRGSVPHVANQTEYGAELVKRIAHNRAIGRVVYEHHNSGMN